MDELTSVDPNEIESAGTDEILLLSNAPLKVPTKTTKEPVDEPMEEPPDQTYMERFMNKKFIFSWQKVVEEADILFDYLIRKYETMLDGEDKIKHFDIMSGYYYLIDEADEMKEAYSDKIQSLLVPWIRNEFKIGDLLKIHNWRPFRDPDLLVRMFLGYRKFFQYKHYLFQLTVSWYCENDTTICKYCAKGDYGRHFGVALYGWRDIKYKNLQPLDILPILDDNLYPESHWSVKV